MGHRNVNFDSKNDRSWIVKAHLTPMQFLRTKQVPEMRLTGNHNSLSSIAGVCLNTWKPASSRCMIACTVLWHDGWVTFASFAAEMRLKMRLLFVAWVSPSSGNPWQLLPSHTLPLCAHVMWLAFFLVLFSTLTVLIGSDRLMDTDPSPSTSSMLQHETSTGTFQFAVVLFLMSVTSDVAVVRQTTHSTAATLWCDSAAQHVKGCDGRMYPLCLGQWSFRFHCLYCQVVGGHTQLQALQVVLAAHTHAHAQTHVLMNFKKGKSKDEENRDTIGNSEGDLYSTDE